MASWAINKWVTHSGFRIVFRLTATVVDARATVEVATDSEFASIVGTSTDSYYGGISPGSYVITGLTPATTYYWRITDNVTSERITGQARTFPLGAANVKIIAGSCAGFESTSGAATGFSNSTIYTRVKARDPNLFLHLGDLHYKDRCTDDDFETVYSLAEPGALFRTTPWGYMWDDHDYAGNDSGGDFDKGSFTNSRGQTYTLTRAAARNTFQDYAAFRVYSTGGLTNEPSMHEIVIGRIRVVMLDTRSERASGAMLGTIQVAELTEVLDQAAASQNEALMICSPVPWIAPTTQTDTWGGYATQRDAIATLIHERGLTQRVFFVCGDMHGLAYDNGTNNRYGAWSTLSAGPPVFQVGALDSTASTKGGPYSGGTSAGRFRFGEFDIADTGTNTIGVTFRGWFYSANVGTEMLTYSFTLNLGQVIDPEIPDEEPPVDVEGSQNVDTLERDSADNVAALGRTRGPTPPTIVTTTLPEGVAGDENDYETQIVARGDPATSWTVDSTLPFSIDSNGLLTLPRESLVPGLYEVVVTVTNDTDTDTATYDFLIPNEMAGGVTPIISSILLVPDTVTVAVAGTSDLEATVTDQTNALVQGVQVTPQTSNGNIGVVAITATDGDGIATVRVTGVAVGNSLATVRVGTVVSNSISAVVTAPAAAIEAEGTEVSTPTGAIALLGIADDVAEADIVISGGTVPSTFRGEIGLESIAGEAAITATGTVPATFTGSIALIGSAPPVLTEDEAVAIVERRERVRKLDDPLAPMVFDFRAAIESGDAIASATVTCTCPGFEDLDARPQDFMFGPPGTAGELIVQNVYGGVADVRYLLRCVVTTTLGQRLVRELRVRVLETWRTSRRIV